MELVLGFSLLFICSSKGRYKNGWGMGRAVEMELEQTRENIVINHGECLNKRSADSKIKQIIKLFGID